MFYENFIKLCEEHGVKPGTVSRATGVTTSTLTAWKQGKYTPKVGKLQVIADYFQVPLEAIMGEDAPIQGVSPESWDKYLDMKDAMADSTMPPEMYDGKDDPSDYGELLNEEDKEYFLEKLKNLAERASSENLILLVNLLRKLNSYDAMCKEVGKR